jgi:hydroxymethylpyrimidine pyrophosphatase-like HAD family hydrolase
MTSEPLGVEAAAWLALEPCPPTRLVVCDIDGVITRGEGQPVDLHVIARLAALNRAARTDPYVPAVTLGSGRQAPYAELMAQLTDSFLPCIFEHGAGLFFPRTFRYEFNVAPGYAERLASLRVALEPVLLSTGRAFVQPGKEATTTLYPFSASLDEVFEQASEIVAQRAPGFDVTRNLQAVEVRPHGIDKALGVWRIAELLQLALERFAGIGDTDPDVGFLRLCGFSAAPANATPAVRAAVHHVSQHAFGEGLLDILHMLESRNRTVPPAAH